MSSIIILTSILVTLPFIPAIVKLFTQKEKHIEVSEETIDRYFDVISKIHKKD